MRHCLYCRKSKELKDFTRKESTFKQCNLCNERQIITRNANRESRIISEYKHKFKRQLTKYPVYRYNGEWKLLPGQRNENDLDLTKLTLSTVKNKV